MPRRTSLILLSSHLSISVRPWSGIFGKPLPWCRCPALETRLDEGVVSQVSEARLGPPDTCLEDRIPPPLFCTQNPCFLEVAGRVAPQNPDNNEVPCKIVQDKELRAVSASAGSFRAGTMI